MSAGSWRHALVLGGIRSGKSEYAESLIAPYAQVRYVATARRLHGDDDWNARLDAHRARRPAGWITAEIGDTPDVLPNLVAAAPAGDTLLIDDLGTWVASLLENSSVSTIDVLATAVERCPARLVLVSPEVGLSVVPANAAARHFADALGTANRVVAAVCDRVTLVIAGNAVPVKGGP